ncbi:phosphatase PAP2 family protein [Oenococcus kitaharae]|uniref:Membrane-associated phospholipid phosphatase n=1 Tax=Oenococcus kitaharae DSM 17330 TaxID=1045004 RepID=G9WG15_9LACO|nr:phosphatase PAP2 family protein [Oenococcus kitaharae]EHN59593.1 Membrane-associated phospholipid phosphatase [Oenococcus kitaharae DSM 17330]OEY83439.1 hypothetical protein NT95_04765 [Oenococcus kitaharae]OEY85238.1 hypothetical protein NT96_01210 [Oenococcus kitaharae]OEY86092.1 hypothetical protein NV75_01160 [Oenococcus kitaharae]
MIDRLTRLDKSQLLIGFGGFAILMLTVLAQSRLLRLLDLQGIRLISFNHNPSLIAIVNTISFFGSPPVAIILSFLIIVFVLWRRQRYIEAVWATMLLLSGNAVCFLLKELVRRPRPETMLIKDTGFSFPSGHVFSTALFVFLVWHFMVANLKKQRMREMARIGLVIWLLIIALSRIYLQVHFPSDVLASVLLALGMAAFTKQGLKPLSRSERISA